MEWPERSIPARVLRGKLVTAEDLDDVAKPFPNVEIELLDLRTSQLIETAFTNADGRYEFSTQESGVYVLRVKPPIPEGKTKSETHEIAVRVDSGTKGNTLPELTVLQSNCGGLQFFRKIGKAWQAQ